MSEICPMEMFSPMVHCNHTAWQRAISILLSHTTQTTTTVQNVCWMCFNIYFSAICAATSLQCENHCYSQGIMIFDNSFQEINSRKTGYGWVIIAPFYWHGFHTDQDLMGFIIKSDDSSPLCLAFVGAKQNGKVDISQITSDWSWPSYCERQMKKTN